MLKVEKLKKDYGRDRGVFGVDFTLGPGITGLLGRNGAGKTTLLRMLAGILPPDAGQVDAAGGTPGFLPDQDYFFPDLTGRENLDFLRRLKHLKDEVWTSTLKLSQDLQVEGILDQVFREGSLGMRKKIQLLGLLMDNPPVLLLDEPQNGLDVFAALILEQQLKVQAQAGRCILLSSHAVDWMERLCDRVLILEKGRIVADLQRPFAQPLAEIYLKTVSS